MHAILDLKTNGSVDQYDQSLEEGLRQTRTSRLFVHDHRA